MAALIDAMEFPAWRYWQVLWGRQAPSSSCYAIPEKVWALALLSPVTKLPAESPRTELGDGFCPVGSPETLVLGSPSGLHGKGPAADPSAEFLRRRMKATDAERDALADSVVNSADQLEWFRSFIGTFVPPSAREAGLRNDLQQIRTVNRASFGADCAPTLIMHGTADKVVPLFEAEAMAARIPGATLYAVEGAGHLVEVGPVDGRRANEDC